MNASSPVGKPAMTFDALTLFYCYQFTPSIFVQAPFAKANNNQYLHDGDHRLDLLPQRLTGFGLTSVAAVSVVLLVVLVLINFALADEIPKGIPLL